eukprot:CAMPEP_0201932912 /NCGR_PEP_ID=MMETSP0903-20130614/30466_1 /ASSEMBLY_ACC=CAM_ASM_000552 /TAXON_ID=420261 /ORGANISM="Thalassiosira antarctica, Strain CCMP982" /LENGTH=779 /DNA_ID=CAMNT_0048472681 /DNA_START=11 /DNA_END=2350 /DNA_ORIENTATION=+
MADNDEAPCSILQANSEDNRNNDRIISRKRRLKTNYYPPSKRARVDCSDVQHNNGDKSSNVTNDGGNLHGNPRDTSITKSGSNHKRSNRSKNCKRYRRPMIRLLTGKTKHRLNGKPPPSKLDARFKELIAQGAVSHILRECRLKAVLRECRQKAVARKNAEEVDSLYGYGDETLHFPARTFGGSVLSCKDETFKSTMMPKVGPNSLARSRRTNPPLVHLEEEHEMPKDATDEELLTVETKMKMKSQCKTSVVEELEEDVLPVSRENTNDHNSPPSTEKVDSPNEASEPNFPSNNADPNRRHLPFDFMSGTSNAASTPRGKITRVFTASHGTSTSRIKVSNRGLRKSIASRATNTCVYTNDYSPIRPRLSRGPIMAPFDTSSFSLREPPISSANNVQEIPITPVRNPAKSKSLPFNFMSGDDPTKESNTNFPRTGMAAPYSNLVSIVKYIISVAANWLLSWRSMPQGNGVHSNHSSPISSTSPISSSPRGSMNNSLLGSVTETSTTTTRPLPYRREFSVSSRGRDSSLPFPPSNRAFLSTNDRPPYVPLNEPKFGGDTASNNTSSSGQRTNNGYNVKNRTDTAPPRGWKSFFQPKVGEWKCEACFYINPAEAMTCDSCTALNRRTDDLNVVDLDVFVDDDDLNVVDLNVFDDEASGYDDGITSKRIKINSTDMNSNGNADQTVIGHAPDRTEKRSQNRGTSSGKRMKVDRSQGLKGDGIAPDAMSTDSPDTSGSKKRNKSDEDNDEVNHSSKAARAQDGSQMAMEDANLLELMDIESPSR